MQKRKRKYIEYEKRRRNKIMRRKSRQKKNHYSVPRNIKKVYRQTQKPWHLVAPRIFSIEHNAEESIAFFSKAFDTINKCSKRGVIFFDLSQITEVTSDAVMYFIALINNTRRISILDITCRGNLPENAEARRIFEVVGFYDYVSIKRKHAQPGDPDRIKILHGTESNANVTATVCDFICEKSNANSKMPTKRLYPMLVELMTNTKQHAYKEDKGKMISNWYIYVENCPKVVKLVFLDTGLGIPTTIRKNWYERLKGFVKDEDERYIEAALLGEFRTETRQEHRGKGLPEIYNAFRNPSGRLTNLSIISGKGICVIKKEGEIVKRSIPKTFEGTLFSWNFVKEVDNYDDN